MKEKILTTRKSGMAVLLLTIALYVAAIALLLASIGGVFTPTYTDANGVSVIDQSAFDPTGLIVIPCLIWLVFGWLMLLGTVIVAQPMVWYYRRTAQRQFGGISGDLAGWFLVKMEFWLLAAMVLAQQGGRAI